MALKTTYFPLLVFLMCFFSVGLAVAADLRIESWRGHKVLSLSGTINAGTADKFSALAAQTPKMPHGVPVLLLDSPGGSVSEAMKISKIMDGVPFHTIIPNGARCASACGSIVFIAGKYRTVEPLGLLGHHSCSINGQPFHACNELISQHGLHHGVSHGSIAAFVTYVLPNEILWFSRKKSDGYGLTRYPGERMSGFEKSEPIVIEALFGRMPPAQSAWRLDFHEDGFRAFLRPASDHEREMQTNLFCNERLHGRLFLSMEINGPVKAVAAAVRGLRVTTDRFAWSDISPTIWQADERVSEVITEIPKVHIIEFLTRVKELEFNIDLRKPLKPMIARTTLTTSGRVLRFAANHCPSGTYQGRKAPLQ